ncbi:MAG: DNA-directed RNA polymerase subunit N [Candidatus Woesearchaeota archaeon]|jgi:DNA-directed RNA polymerase subunit N (RpoN/RPB10)
MIVPMRCFSCGKPVSHLWEDYNKRLDRGDDKKKVMDDLGLERPCCRALFLTHCDLIDLVAQYKKD